MPLFYDLFYHIGVFVGFAVIIYPNKYDLAEIVLKYRMIMLVFDLFDSCITARQQAEGRINYKIG